MTRDDPFRRGSTIAVTAPDDVNRPRTLANGDLFGKRFEIVAEAGSGGMGKVFEAIDRETRERVALKLVTSAADRVRFTAEAEILEALEHPAIVKYVAHGETDDGHPFLVMEWLVGENLATRLDRGRLSITEATTLGHRIAGALAHAHEVGVVHRDLKPSNIYLVDKRVELARLIDFGVAKTEERDLTQTGQMIGTPGYMSPEQVRGDKDVDQRCDVFALGCVLHEALVGAPTYDGEEVMEVISHLLLDNPARIEATVPDVPPRIVYLIDAMLVKDQARRLADCGIARDELATIQQALATGDHATLAMRSPRVPVAPIDTATTRSGTTAADHASTVIDRPGARRPASNAPPVARGVSGRWILLAVAGVVFGVAVAAYLVMRGDAVTPLAVLLPDAAPPPVCTQTLRTGCGALCSAGDGQACFLHAQELLAGQRGIGNRDAATTAYHRGCDLGVDRACVAGAEVLVLDGTLAEVDLAYSLLVKSCDRGDPPSCRVLGNELRLGGAWEDETEHALAYELIGRACAKDDPAACSLLAEMVSGKEGDRGMRKRAQAVREAACTRKVADACD